MPTPENAESAAASPREELLERWLDSLLPLAGREGWTVAVAARAGEEAGLSEAEQVFAAPHGVDSLIDGFLSRADRAMSAALAAPEVTEMRVRDRVALGVMSWLDALEPHKEAMSRAVGRGLQPWNVPTATERTWALADQIWEGAGDTATDYNRYTKRGLLALILPPVTLYWLRTEDREAVKAFLDRRVDGAMRTGRTAGKVIGPVLDRLFGSRK